MEDIMASVFKKLISKELGKNNYNRYFFCYQKGVNNKASSSKEIYNDIYERLKDRDINAIKKMHKRLNDAMIIALRISKTYFFALIFFIGASLFLIGQDLKPVITIISLVIMCLCFVYKTFEFIVNKYCFIDAQIVLVYKAVLDELILRYQIKSMK